MFATELARRHPEITSVSVHPGVIKTDLYAPSSKSNSLLKYGMMLTGMFLKDIHQGALNQIWAATTAKENIVNGAYYTPVGNKSGGGRYTLSKYKDFATELWDWTDGELAKEGF